MSVAVIVAEVVMMVVLVVVVVEVLVFVNHSKAGQVAGVAAMMATVQYSKVTVRQE